MGWLIMLVVAALIALWFMMRNSKWTTILVSDGFNGEQLEAKYAYLQSHQVKCRLDAETVPIKADGVIRHGLSDHSRHISKLLVHDKDVERANLLLEQFDQEMRPY